VQSGSVTRLIYHLHTTEKRLMLNLLLYREELPPQKEMQKELTKRSNTHVQALGLECIS